MSSIPSSLLQKPYYKHKGFWVAPVVLSKVGSLLGFWVAKERRVSGLVLGALAGCVVGMFGSMAWYESRDRTVPVEPKAASGAADAQEPAAGTVADVLEVAPATPKPTPEATAAPQREQADLTGESAVEGPSDADGTPPRVRIPPIDPLYFHPSTPGVIQ